MMSITPRTPASPHPAISGPRPPHDPTKLPDPGAVHTVDRSGNNSEEALRSWMASHTARRMLPGKSVSLEALIAGKPCIRRGEITNAIVMVAGFPEAAETFSHQIRAAAQAGLYVIAINLPGFPGSNAPADKRQLGSTQAALELAGMLDKQKICKAVFLGHDWGAAVVSKMATLAATQKRVAALGLLNNGWDSSLLGAIFTDEKQRRASRYIASLGGKGGLAYARQNDFEVMRNAFDRTAGKGAYTPGERDRAVGLLRADTTLDTMLQWYRNLMLIPGLEAALLASTPGELAMARATFEAFLRTSPFPKPARYEGPAAQIIGANDPYLTAAASAVPREVVPRITTRVLPTTSHFSHRENPADVNEMMIGLARSAGML